MRLSSLTCSCSTDVCGFEVGVQGEQEMGWWPTSCGGAV